MLLSLTSFLMACDGDNIISNLTTEPRATEETTNINLTNTTTTDDGVTEETTITGEVTSTEETTTFEEITSTEEVTTTENSTTEAITTTEETTTEQTTTEQITTTESLTTITFMSNGGSAITTIEALPGTYIQTPSDPIRDGYEFIGWFSDQALTNLYVFSEMPNENIILYAGWSEIVTPTDSFLSILIEYDFICTANQCTYQNSPGYNYIYDINNKVFIYEKITSVSDSGFYEYLTNTITINTNWDVEFSYDKEENYGIEFITQLELSGNVLTNNYTVDYFYSNILEETKEKMMQLMQLIPLHHLSTLFLVGQK